LCLEETWRVSKTTTIRILVSPNQGKNNVRMAMPSTRTLSLTFRVVAGDFRPAMCKIVLRALQVYTLNFDHLVSCDRLLS